MHVDADLCIFDADTCIFIQNYVFLMQNYVSLMHSDAELCILMQKYMQDYSSKDANMIRTNQIRCKHGSGSGFLMVEFRCINSVIVCKFVSAFQIFLARLSIRSNYFHTSYPHGGLKRYLIRFVHKVYSSGHFITTPLCNVLFFNYRLGHITNSSRGSMPGQ